MTVDKVKLKALAEGMKGWDKMTECWPSDENGPDWQVGRLDEDDNRWPLLTVDTEQYDQEQDAPKIAQYYAAANPVAVLALLAEIDQFKVENEQLREASDKLTRRNGMLEENVQTLSDTHVLYTWLRKKVDQPSNDVVAVQMNIGHDWVPVHDLDRDLRTMIDQEVP